MEYIAITNEDNEMTGDILPRNIVHEKGFWHRTVHVWIINNDNKILIQQRSANKDSYPNKWDMSCGGHIVAGDSSITTLAKEMEEEVGLTISPGDTIRCITTLKHSDISNNGKFIDNEYSDVYIINKNFSLNDLTLQESEVQNTRLVSIDTLVEMSMIESTVFSSYNKEVEILQEYL